MLVTAKTCKSKMLSASLGSVDNFSQCIWKYKENTECLFNIQKVYV